MCFKCVSFSFVYVTFILHVSVLHVCFNMCVLCVYFTCRCRFVFYVKVFYVCVSHVRDLTVCVLHLCVYVCMFYMCGLPLCVLHLCV